MYFSSGAHVLGALLLYEISYETTNARNYAHTFARRDIREDNTGVRSAFPGNDERTRRKMRDATSPSCLDQSLSAHNIHARRYKNNEYHRLIQYERHDCPRERDYGEGWD